MAGKLQKASGAANIAGIILVAPMIYAHFRSPVLTGHLAYACSIAGPTLLLLGCVGSVIAGIFFPTHDEPESARKGRTFAKAGTLMALPAALIYGLLPLTPAPSIPIPGPSFMPDALYGASIIGCAIFVLGAAFFAQASIESTFTSGGGGGGGGRPPAKPANKPSGGGEDD